MMLREFAKLTPAEAEMYGAECRRAYDAAPVYAGLAHPAAATVGEKLFLPPPRESATQIPQPTSPRRAAWRRGWNGA